MSCATANTKHSLREKRLYVHKPTRRDAKQSQLGTRRQCLSRGEIPTLLRVFQADSYTNTQSGRSGERRGARLQPGQGIRGERLAVRGRELINKRVPSLSTSASGFLDSHDWSLVRGRHCCSKAPPEAIIKLFSKKKEKRNARGHDVVSLCPCRANLPDFIITPDKQLSLRPRHVRGQRPEFNQDSQLITDSGLRGCRFCCCAAEPLFFPSSHISAGTNRQTATSYFHLRNIASVNHSENTEPAEPLGYGRRKMQIKSGYESRWCETRRLARRKWDLFLPITISCVSQEIINTSTCGPMFYSAERSRNRFALFAHADDVFCTSRLKS